MSYTHNMSITHSSLQVKPQVSILGIGRTDFAPQPGTAVTELVYRAVHAALADAGLTMRDVDARVTASVDLWDGLTASNVTITEVVGAVMRPETRVAGDGLLAVCQGVMSIMAGAYQTVLVVAHCKATMGDRWGITNWTFDPIYQQPLGLDDFSAAALQASALAVRSTPRSDSGVVLDGAGVPNYEQSRLLPCPPADGAAAVILSSRPAPVTIRGMGWAIDEHYLGDRDLTDSPALRQAARRAYALTGINDPKRELTFAELSNHFDYQRALWASVLGLDGFPNLNLSGGLSRGVPPFVAGLDRLIEIVLRLREKSGIGLAHGCWGPAGQGQVVMVVGR
jgi:acetyl-CoA C-acetyltransferase